MTGQDDISQALRGSREDLFARPNVVATGVGYKVTEGRRTGELSIVCSVEHKVPRARLAEVDLVPRDVGGVPTDVVATGRLRALHDPRARWRPAPGGVSVGHRDVTAGTFGCLVRRGDETYILSNNHVLANGNAGVAGDPILQPAPYDGGTDPDDRIAELADYVALHLREEESGCGAAQGAARVLNAVARLFGSGARLRAVSVETPDNLVDAALARPLSPELVEATVAEIGEISGTEAGALGMAVRKSGRTTGYTEGEITQVDVTADVWYGERAARFTDQLMAGDMSRGGDSGSAVVDGQGRLVGLLFGGSDSTTLINRIEHVFDALGVEL